MHKIAISAIAFIFFVLFVAPFLLLSTLNSISFFNQPSFDSTDDVYANRIFKQEFNSYENYLDGIGLSIRNPALRNKKIIKIEVYKDNILLRETEISGENIPDGDFIRFSFIPIEDSKGKTYAIVITAPESIQDNCLSISLSNNRSIELGELSIDGNKSSNKVAMIGYYKVERKYILFDYVYKNFLINFSKDINFVIFYIILIMLLLSGLVIKKTR